MFKKKDIFNIKNNTLILIYGKDKFKFIQGIISNDIEILKKKKSIYSSILTPQGRFIHDFIISIWNNSFILECCKFDVQEILKKLNLYKLKSDVNFEIKDNCEIFLTNYSSLKNLNLKIENNSF